MLFKKKPPLPPDLAPDHSSLFIDLASELYQDMGSEDPTATLTLKLEFDSEQRVVQINNPKFSSQSKFPSFETLEKLNRLTSHLKYLPRYYQLKSLDIIVKDGEITAKPVYAEN